MNDSAYIDTYSNFRKWLDNTFHNAIPNNDELAEIIIDDENFEYGGSQIDYSQQYSSEVPFEDSNLNNFEEAYNDQNADYAGGLDQV